jgi:RNA polymerase sigma-70 factor (ECF subfamily)
MSNGRRDMALATTILSGGSVTNEVPTCKEQEDELVKAARADLCQFSEIYHRYVDRIYRYCLVRLGDPHSAEDATSEIFLKALSGLQGFRGGSLSAWLFRICHNVVIDLHRKRKSHMTLDDSDELRDSSPGPEKVAEMRAEQLAVRKALASLPSDQRAVLELQLAGWSGQDIANAIGRTGSAIKMLRYRAIRRLRELLMAETPPTEVGEQAHWRQREQREQREEKE